MTRPDRKLARVAAPLSEPLSLADVKTYLRVEGDDDDALIGEMIVAVRIAAEEATGKSLLSQSWKLIYADNLPCDVLLPFGPVQAVTSVTVFDAAGDETVVDAGSYHLHPAADRLVSESAISGHRIEVVYVAGYGDEATDIPATLRQGMLLHVLNLYAQRDSLSAPDMALAAYAMHREVRL